MIWRWFERQNFAYEKMAIHELVKLSLLPFCGWIPRPTKARFWTIFDFKRTQLVQYFAGSIGWLDTYKLRHSN